MPRSAKFLFEPMYFQHVFAGLFLLIVKVLNQFIYLLLVLILFKCVGL